MTRGRLGRRIALFVHPGNIDNPLYSALQNQAIRNAKSDDDDKPIEYMREQPIEINTQNWEIHTTGNESVVIGFRYLSGWWHTPIHIHDSIQQPVRALLDGDAEKTKLSVWREGTTGNARSLSSTTSNKTTGESPLVLTMSTTPSSLQHQTTWMPSLACVVSGKEHKFVRRYYRSLRGSLQETGAYRARNRVGNNESRRIQHINHTLSKRLFEHASHFSNPVIKPEISKTSVTGASGRSPNSNSSSRTRPRKKGFALRR